MKLYIKSIGVVIIFIIIFLILLILQFLHRVSESHYSILDQTGKVELKDYPELKDMSFEYNADLSVEFTEPTSLELEKINFRVNDEAIGIVEINKKLNDLEDFAEPYINEETKERIIRKTYPLQKEFLRILGRKNEKYKLGTGTMEGRFYIDIYIKDLKTNETFIIKRDNISIYYESGGLKIFIPNI